MLIVLSRWSWRFILFLFVQQWGFLRQKLNQVKLDQMWIPLLVCFVIVSVHFKETELVTFLFNVFTMICSHFIDDKGLNQRLNLVSVSVFRSAIVAIHCKLSTVPAVLVHTHPVYRFLLWILHNLLMYLFLFWLLCVAGVISKISKNKILIFYSDLKCGPTSECFMTSDSLITRRYFC